jgi:hypothetical protein
LLPAVCPGYAPSFGQGKLSLSGIFTGLFLIQDFEGIESGGLARGLPRKFTITGKVLKSIFNSVITAYPRKRFLYDKFCYLY